MWWKTIEFTTGHYKCVPQSKGWRGAAKRDQGLAKEAYLFRRLLTTTTGVERYHCCCWRLWPLTRLSWSDIERKLLAGVPERICSSSFGHGRKGRVGLITLCAPVCRQRCWKVLFLRRSALATCSEMSEVHVIVIMYRACALDALAGSVCLLAVSQVQVLPRLPFGRVHWAQRHAVA